MYTAVMHLTHNIFAHPSSNKSLCTYVCITGSHYSLPVIMIIIGIFTYIIIIFRGTSTTSLAVPNPTIEVTKEKSPSPPESKYYLLFILVLPRTA